MLNAREFKKDLKTVIPWASRLNGKIVPSRKNESYGYLLGECILKMMTQGQSVMGTMMIAMFTE